MGDQTYAGDITAKTAWEILTDDPSAVLVDVRTEPEWRYVGLPDLEELGKTTVLVSWQAYPEMQMNEGFTREVEAAGVARDDTVLLLCRSGQRSARAAEALTAAGFRRCYNVVEGFEGGKDGDGHRGKREGWKVAGLPWRQE